MKRRHFVGLAGVGAGGTLATYSPAAGVSAWQRDGVGSVARFGVLTPAFDPVPESEGWAMAPEGVSIHGSPVQYKRGDARSFAEPPHIDNAVELLAALNPRAILYAFTSSSYVLGREGDDSLRVRLETRAPGVPIVFAAQAALEAARTLQARRLALIHPPWFSEEMNSRGKDYFESRDFEVVSCTRLTPLRDFTEVPPAEVHEWTKANVPPRAEAVVICGNGLRAIGAIRALEDTLGRPVLTANQVTMWKALQIAGVTSQVGEYGRLFRRSAAQQ